MSQPIKKSKNNFFSSFMSKLSVCTKRTKENNYDYLPYARVERRDFRHVTLLPLAVPRKLNKQCAASNLKIVKQSNPIKFGQSSIYLNDLTTVFNKTEAKMLNQTTSAVIQKSVLSTLSNEHEINEQSFEESLLYSACEYTAYCTSDDSYSSELSSSFDYTQPTQTLKTVNYSTCDQSILSASSTENVALESGIYLCNQDFQANIKGDINLKHMDKVKVIHVNQDYALVKKLSTGETGYCPKRCINFFFK